MSSNVSSSNHVRNKKASGILWSTKQDMGMCAQFCNTPRHCSLSFQKGASPEHCYPNLCNSHTPEQGTLGSDQPQLRGAAPGTTAKSWTSTRSQHRALDSSESWSKQTQLEYFTVLLGGGGLESEPSRVSVSVPQQAEESWGSSPPKHLNIVRQFHEL